MLKQQRQRNEDPNRINYEEENKFDYDRYPNERNQMDMRDTNIMQTKQGGAFIRHN